MKIIKHCFVVSCFLLFVSRNVIAQTNTFPSSGNTGVGTVSPNSKLEIHAPESDGSGSTNAMMLRSTTGSANQQVSIGINQSGLYAFLQASQASVGYKPLSLNPNGGNVGVGSTNPSSKLEVYAPESDGTGSANAMLLRSTTGSANQQLLFGTNQTGLYAFLQSSQASVGYKSMILNPNGGNIGIGTTSPSAKLDINGNAYVNGNISANGFITTKKVTVTQVGWSDYVFDKKYKLRSFSSLESFIKQNKHLPEVPSAKEVEEKGISVGDNQALLLKKIEELTLYVIQQQKEIEKLKKKIK